MFFCYFCNSICTCKTFVRCHQHLFYFYIIKNFYGLSTKILTLTLPFTLIISSYNHRPPLIFNKGLPGNLDDLYLAGITNKKSDI